MRRLTGSLGLPLLLLAGCASGFDRQALTSRMQNESLSIVDPDQVKARQAPPQLKFPCRVAVYLRPDGRDGWRWDAKDKAVMESWAKVLRDDGIVSDVFFLPTMLTGKGEPAELRLAAMNSGADALLVVHGAYQVDKYINPAAMFNLTVVGGYLVPGSHRDALFMMEGCLFDPATGFVFAGVEAEGEGRIVRPTFTIEEKDAVVRAKAEALENFGPELLKRMRNLAGK